MNAQDVAMGDSESESESDRIRVYDGSPENMPEKKSLAT